LIYTQVEINFARIYGTLTDSLGFKSTMAVAHSPGVVEVEMLAILSSNMEVL